MISLSRVTTMLLLLFSLVIDKVAEAIKEGLTERKAEKDKEGADKKPVAKKARKSN